MERTEKKHVTMEERYRKAQKSLLFWFCVLIVIITAFLSLALLQRFGEIIRQKVAVLVAADAQQLELNINSYLDKTETTVTLLFSDENYYLYDATDKSLDEYDRVKKEEVIVNRISDLALMQNFSDFGIIYANGHTTGWFSNVTQGLFPDGDIYEQASAQINRSRTEDGWFFGIQGNTDRLYYVKRLNPNAVLLASFYNRELETVFEYPEELRGMTIRLVDEENTILFSTEKEEIGGQVPADIADAVGAHGNTSTLNRTYLVDTNECTNGWKVVCSIPVEVILRESNELRVFVAAIAAIMIVLFVLIAILVFRWRTRSMNGVVSNLQEQANYDQLTGLLNKSTFEYQVNEQISRMNPVDCAFMVMLDMDHFKQINDHLGHERGDEALHYFGGLLKEQIDPTDLAGRMGGDEFAVFGIAPDTAKTEKMEELDKRMEELREHFVRKFAKEHEELGLSISMGNAVMEHEDVTFRKLYRRADMALYYSKNSGKGQSSWYQEDSQGE